VVATAWDKRDEETPKAFERFQGFLATPRSERARSLRSSSQLRVWVKQHDWWARAAAYDDQCDHDYEQARLEHVREVRGYHASVGRELLELAVARLEEVTEWRPGDLVRLADLARKMELTAVLGSASAMTTASRVAIAAAGGDLDEWDRLATDLANTLPPER
jgi:hypothetical protein